MPLFQVPESRNERVNLFASVVQSERGPDGRLDPEAAEDGLGTVVARPDRNTLTVEGRAHVFGAEAVEDKGKNAGFFARRSDQSQARNTVERVGGVEQQVMLVAGNIGHTDAVQVVDGRAKANGVSDVTGAGFEAAGAGW